MYRAEHPGVREEWAAAALRGRLLTTPPMVFEVLYSARNRREYDLSEEELDALPAARFPSSVWPIARGAQRELAAKQSGYHRVSLVDALIAAAAQENVAGVLHYDHHYDRLAEVLRFESRWIAPAGTLD